MCLVFHLLLRLLPRVARRLAAAGAGPRRPASEGRRQGAASWPRYGWLLLAAGLPLAATAQRVPPPTHWSPSIYLDNRNPFEDAAAVRVIGLNLGVTPPGRRYRVGISGYTLRRSYAQYYTYQGKGKNQKIKDSYSPELSLLYVTPSFTYTVLARRYFELNVPLDMGVGGSHFTVTDEKGRLVRDEHDVFIPVEAGVGVLLKPTRWVGVSGGVGYRQALGDVEFADDFNGWYYCYRLNVFVGAIWTDLHHRRAPPPLEAPCQP